MSIEYLLNNRYHRWTGAKKIIDGNKEIIHINNLHSVIKIFGYLKHILKDENKYVYLRGQGKLYDTFKPTAYRDINTQNEIRNIEANLVSIISYFKNRNRALGKIDNYVIEPILQHYGINTTWLDLVDNIWIAIWFAINKRIRDSNSFRYILSENEYGYLIFVSVDSGDMSRGIVSGVCTETIDLRIAAPSYFGRPHAQHAILFRSKDRSSLEKCNYQSNIAGVLRFNLRDGLQWLGSGHLVSQEFLFPSDACDDGYRKLLGCKFCPSDLSGAIGDIDRYENT